MDRRGVSVLKRLILFLTLLSVAVWGITAQELKMRIIENLAQLVTGKTVPSVYTDFTVPSDAFTKGSMRLVRNCLLADVVFVKTPEIFFQDCDNTKEKLIFVLSYRDYMRYKDKLIGAFFWQKGRPNIILNEKILKARHISLPKRYEKYVE